MIFKKSREVVAVVKGKKALNRKKDLQKKDFKVLVYQDNESYYAECINIPGAIAQGKTEEEATRNIHLLIKWHLNAQERRNAIPGYPLKSLQVSV
ncbi:MAG: type II toxin-antitoxin system HicB family antitoxin [Candidatus Diapherotrites archaeon]|nr:type II toxin-antitoxin system HicB family antitoxin [Candidatus Diapherotrites archaeon]